MSRILRHFFSEYVHWAGVCGPVQLPTSFNVVEVFLRFSTENVIFDLREEEEHLLGAYDFFNWYTAEGRTLTKDLGILKDLLREGVVYSYDMIDAPSDSLVSTEDSQLALLGISVVRHQDELSVILLAGENPPYPTDEEVRTRSALGRPVPGKEAIAPDASLTIADRIVPGLPNYSQVILLTRIYIESRSYDVRYVNLDIGKSFLVLTDDRTALTPCENKGAILADSKQRLRRYDDLFSALSALIFLPVYFVARRTEVVCTRFATELSARRNSAKVMRAYRLLGKEAVTLHREVRCLAGEQSGRYRDF